MMIFSAAAWPIDIICVCLEEFAIEHISASSNLNWSLFFSEMMVQLMHDMQVQDEHF